MGSPNVRTSMPRWLVLLSCLLLACCQKPGAATPIVSVPSPSPADASAPPREHASTTPPPWVPGSFAFVENVGEREVALLLSNGDAAWRSGPLELVSPPDQSDRIVRAEVDPRKLPRGLALEGQSVDVYAGNDKTDVVALGHVYLVGLAFDVEEPRQPGSARPTNAEIAEAAWGGGPKWLVADLQRPRVKRAGVEWARLSNLPRPGFPVDEPRSPAIEKALFQALRALPESATAQESFQSSSQPTPAPNARWEDGGSSEVRVFSWQAKNFVFGRIEAGEVCGFRAVVAGLFEQKPRGLTLISKSDAWDAPLLLVDVDGDGALEAVVESLTARGSMLVLFGRDGAELLSGVRPTFGCPC